MTYNFDPDGWYENELRITHSKYLADKMTKQEHEMAIEELDRKHKNMWKRLDGSYQIPK